MINNILKISGGGNSLHVGDIIESYQNLEQEYPNEWMLADGRLLKINDYSELAELLNNSGLPKAWIKSLTLNSSFTTLIPTNSKFNYNKNNGTIVNYSIGYSDYDRTNLIISNDYGVTWRTVTLKNTSGSMYLGSCTVSDNKILIITTNTPNSTSKDTARATLFDLDVTDTITMGGSYFDNKSNVSWVFYLNGRFVMYRYYENRSSSNFKGRLCYSSNSANIPTAEFIREDIDYCNYNICEDSFLIRYALAASPNIYNIVYGTELVSGKYQTYTINMDEYTADDKTYVQSMLNPSSTISLFFYKDNYFYMVDNNREIRTKDFVTFEIEQSVRYPYSLYSISSGWSYPTIYPSVNNEIAFIDDNRIYYGNNQRNLCCYDTTLHYLSCFKIPGSSFVFYKDNKIKSINANTLSYGGYGIYDIEIINHNNEFVLPNYNYLYNSETNLVMTTRIYPELKPPTYIKVK